MRRHGFMAQYYVESPPFLNKIPKEIRDFAVLLEPMSVVQKGIDHTYLLQHRLKGWKPKFGDGARRRTDRPARGSRAARARPAHRGRRPRGRRPTCAPQLVKQLGAEYVCVANKALPDVPKETGYPDIVIEATGVSRVVFDAMEILGPNGVLCLLSVTGGDTMNAEPIDLINQRLVLGNQVVFGSVNANPRHFKQGVKDFVTIEKKWPGVMNKLLTEQDPLGRTTRRGSPSAAAASSRRWRSSSGSRSCSILDTHVPRTEHCAVSLSCQRLALTG